MDKSRKIYTKALNKYNNGYIDKAIELCERSISMDLSNSASINLKGLLIYLKGDINTARKLWKMNAQTNKDEVSKKYLENSNEDANRMIFYNSAVSFVKKLRINEAIPLLEKCIESDFNLINVNNYLALCYMKKGEYIKSVEVLDKIFQIDRYNKMAKETRKSLQDMGIVKRQINLKGVICIFIIIITVLLSMFFLSIMVKDNSVGLYNIKKINPLNLLMEKRYYNKEVVNKDEKKEPQKVSMKAEGIKKYIFPYNNIKRYIDNKNYNELYYELVNFKGNDNSLTINEKVLLIKAKKFLSSEGVVYFYNEGCAYLNSGNYSEAKQYLIRAFEYGSSNDVYPDIIYMMGYNFELSGDIENAIKYYDKYDKSYQNGSYEETVIYRLALIYRDLDKSKAKIYAQKLISRYPFSIYNNSVVHSIIET
ncbi:tetratricopeptide repeat protein [Clostridium sp. LBM24168]